jgi:hypothetical protein
VNTPLLMRLTAGLLGYAGTVSWTGSLIWTPLGPDQLARRGGLVRAQAVVRSGEGRVAGSGCVAAEGSTQRVVRGLHEVVVIPRLPPGRAGWRTLAWS